MKPSPDIADHPARLLIVDDERHNRQLLEIMLTPEGFELRSAATGEEALAAVGEQAPDLILLDIMMPGMDGYQVAAQIKGNPTTKNIPIIMVSALDDRNARLLGLSAGAEDFLTKPVDRAELSVRVRNLLRLKAYGDYYDRYSQLLESEVTSRTADLVESERLYRSTFDAAPVGIVHVGLDGHWLRVNQRLCDLLGYSREELLSPAVQQLMRSDGVNGGSEPRHRMAVGILDRHVVEEQQYRRRDDSIIWGRVTTSLHRDAEGQAHFISVVEDITERRADRAHHKEAEEALRKSEAQYRQIVETTSDGIIRGDDDGVIVFVNRRFAEMLGYEPEEMIGTSAFAFMSPAAQGVAADAVQRRRRGIKDVIDTTFRHRDGTDISVNVAGSPVFDGAGGYLGNLGMVRDVTERNKLQSQLMVGDRMASVGTLAAGVAHEINNPLAAVISNLDFIDENVVRMVAGDSAGASSGTGNAWLLEEIKAPLDDAREAAHRVRFIVRDLKIFSRSPDELRGPVDVKATMESALRMARTEIRHRARLVTSYGAVPPVAANEARLGQVFLNLIVNAAQALPEGEAEHNEIRVTSRLDGERVIVEVSDTGAGIPPEIIGRIFDAFFTTKAVGVGTGLGLAICHRIVTDIGGDLTVESKVGTGTTFRVALPIAHADETEAPKPAEPVPAAGRRGRILVVDDEKFIVRGLQRILSKEHDFVGVTAAKEALELCAGGAVFDLIFCDLMMPDMTGMDLHRELSVVAPDQANRMIFLTGGAFTAKARQFLSEMPREYLEKPFAPTNLRAIVQRHLRSAPA